MPDHRMAGARATIAAVPIDPDDIKKLDNHVVTPILAVVDELRESTDKTNDTLEKMRSEMKGGFEVLNKVFERFVEKLEKAIALDTRVANIEARLSALEKTGAGNGHKT